MRVWLSTSVTVRRILNVIFCSGVMSHPRHSSPRVHLGGVNLPFLSSAGLLCHLDFQSNFLFTGFPSLPPSASIDFSVRLGILPTISLSLSHLSSYFPLLVFLLSLSSSFVLSLIHHVPLSRSYSTYLIKVTVDFTRLLDRGPLIYRCLFFAVNIRTL